MSNVFTFTPKHELDHEKNLQEFCELSRLVPPLNDKYDYASNYWKGVGNFTTFGVSNQDRSPENVLDESLLPFAKAFVVYENPAKSKITSRFYALRAINAICVKKYGFVSITKLTAGDLDKAAQIARESLGAGAAYQAGMGIKALLKFLVDHNMISKFTWKNPNKKPVDGATGDEADIRRQDKMPDDNALMALTRISSAKTLDLIPRDIFTTSTMALHFCTPNRGSEPLYLRADCIHSEKMSVQRALDLELPKEDVIQLLRKEGKEDKEGKEADETNLATFLNDKITLLGIKWYSGKGYGHENKWLPSVMYDVANSAIERLRGQSSEARSFAKLLENTSDFPRHNLCPNVAEDKLLTMDEAALALGLDLSSYKDKTQRRTSRNQLLRRKGIARKDCQVCLQDLNKIVHDDLPEGFPFISFKTGGGHVKLKWSNALYAGFVNELDSIKRPIKTELSIPTINTLNEDLAPNKKKNKKTGEVVTGKLSVFQRWDYGNLVITSHQLRHMLDTMAAVNGMAGEMRAKWAQRSDPKHNRYYNHTTPEEYGADFIEDRESDLAIHESGTSNQIQVQVATPRTIQELNTKASLTAHTTEFGMCITSYLSEPCTKYRDCINCNEHVCTKGDDGKCERIRQRLKRENKLLEQDKKAVDDGVQGAEQWYQRRALTTERLKQLLLMMEDPNIENGALIKLSNIEDITQLDRALEANGKKRLPEIINFKRIQTVTVDDIIGLDSDEEAILDELAELDEFDYMMEDES